MAKGADDGRWWSSWAVDTERGMLEALPTVMNIILLTAGTGSYHCGVCMRDNALAKELIRQGHRALLVPMYLPLTLDEESSRQAPIFFGGVSTYLRDKISF